MKFCTFQPFSNLLKQILIKMYLLFKLNCLGAYGKCHHRYSGKNSEGNRFIMNNDL